jgi:hypothetical protein
MSEQMIGLIGGIGGAVIGVLGGVFGTWMSLRACRTPAERLMMWRWSLTFWLGVALFGVLMLTLPSPYRFLLWIPYAILLPLAVTRCNADFARARTQGQG